MYRRVPLKRKTPLKRTVHRGGLSSEDSKPRRWNGMVAISAKLQSNLRKYSNLRKIYLLSNPFCQARLADCTEEATTIHHRKGRGIYLLTVRYFLGVCLNCHRKIEQQPAMAYSKGWSLRRVTNIAPYILYRLNGQHLSISEPDG